MRRQWIVSLGVLLTPPSFLVAQDSVVPWDAGRVYSGEKVFGQFGASMVAVEDLNGDGTLEILVGAPQGSDNCVSHPFLQNREVCDGRAYIVDGRSGEKLQSFEGAQNLSGEYGNAFGASVASGDLDGDGSKEIIVSAPFLDGNSSQRMGMIYAFDPDSPEPLWTYDCGAFPGRLCGRQLDLCDVDGDGADDIVAVGTARTMVVSGATKQLLKEITPPSTARTYGESVSCLKDLNGDARSEFVVGAVRDDTNGAAAGAAFVYDGASLSVLYKFPGEWQEEFGGTVSGAGDVNGDGTEDIIAGSVGRQIARVYSGQDGSLIHEVNVSPVQVRSVSGVGDINGDGFGDFMTSGTFLFSGLTGMIMATFTRDGVVLDGSFGTVLEGPGDINGDGAPDILIGEPGAQINSQEKGRVYVFFGLPGVAPGDDPIQDPDPSEDNGAGDPPPEPPQEESCDEFKLQIELLEAEFQGLKFQCDEEKAVLNLEIDRLNDEIFERDEKIIELIQRVEALEEELQGYKDREQSLRDRWKKRLPGWLRKLLGW